MAGNTPPLPLHILRTRAGLSQRELAAKTGLHHLTINAIENRRQKTRPSTMRRICDELGCRLEDVEEFSERVRPEGHPNSATA